MVECEPEMTAECVNDSLLLSSIQENAPDLVILDANTPRWKLERFGSQVSACDHPHCL